MGALVAFEKRDTQRAGYMDGEIAIKADMMISITSIFKSFFSSK